MVSSARLAAINSTTSAMIMRRAHPVAWRVVAVLSSPLASSDQEDSRAASAFQDGGSSFGVGMKKPPAPRNRQRLWPDFVRPIRRRDDASAGPGDDLRCQLELVDQLHQRIRLVRQLRVAALVSSTIAALRWVIWSISLTEELTSASALDWSRLAIAMTETRSATVMMLAEISASTAPVCCTSLAPEETSVLDL